MRATVDLMCAKKHREWMAIGNEIKALKPKFQEEWMRHFFKIACETIPIGEVAAMKAKAIAIAEGAPIGPSEALQP